MSLNALASPVLHLGGTSATELLAQHREVLNAARALEHAVIAATPHRRDYALLGIHAGNAQYEEDLARSIEVRILKQQER
jgi:hypothetical protein